jgi:hypothetical protein
MPLTKYRSIDEVPGTTTVAAGSIPARLRAIWRRTFAFSPSLRPRGVRRFRDVEAANAARNSNTLERMRTSAKR